MARRKGNAPGVPEKAAANRVEAFRLRRQGLSYGRIGELLGVCDERARQYVQVEMKRLAALCTEEAHELRQLELERLDLLTAKYLPLATTERTSTRGMKAAELLLKVMVRRAAMAGLDQEKVDVTSGGKPVAFVVRVGSGRIKSEKVEEES